MRAVKAHAGLMTTVGRVVLFLALVFTRAVAAGSEPDAPGEAGISPGHEALLAEMLGRGATLPGDCALTAGQVERAVVRGTYTCLGGDVVFELRHPSAASAGAARTARFAIVLLSGSPPPGLVDVLESRIRSREAAFEWTWPSRQSSPSWLRRNAAAITLLAAAGLMAVGALRWVWSRLARWRDAVLGWVSPCLRLWGAVVWRVRLHLERCWDTAQRFRRAPTTEVKRLLRDERFWLLAIFLASAVARGWLSLVNPEANDDHLEVANLIRDGGWLPPAPSACMECSHAKLYHYVLAFAIELTSSGGAGRIVGNLLNFTAGTALLVLLLASSRSARYSPPVRVLGLAFISFNAALVGIFSQTTNDGFCILFSSLAIFYLDRFLTHLAPRQVVAATLFVILAALSKASGWAIFASGVAILCVTFLAAEPSVRKTYVGATAVFVLGFLSVVPLMPPYRDNLVHAHTPFVNDAFVDPLNKIEVPRPPVVWVAQDLLTFRIFELIQVPRVNFVDPVPPLHRTSLWSQLYGRALFLRFDQCIWENADPRLLSLGRLCLVLGVLPLTALLVGIVDQVRSLRHGVSIQGFRWFGARHDWQYLVYIGVVLAALIPLLIKYHRLLVLFTWMKAIYLLPAVVPFYRLFLDGTERLCHGRPRLVTGWMVAMVAASIADLGWLIHDLMGPSRFH